MRYPYLLTAIACLVWNFAAAQRTPTPTPASLPKTRTTIAPAADKQPVAAADRTTLVPAESGKTATTGTQERKKTTKPAATNRSVAPKKTATIPASTSRAGNQANVKPVKPLATTVMPVIKWISIEEALEKSKTEKRKFLVDVYTDWCGWCKHMDSTTFIDPAVVNYINEKYYAVKFNAEQTQDIPYKDKVYKFKKTGARGFHELAALWLNNRLSYPTTVILNEDQDLIQPIPGYQDASKMDAIIHYFGTDSHRKTPWEKYEKNYSREQR